MSFGHRALTLRFFCFHRSGVSFSPELRLDKENSEVFVEHMVGILSIQDEEAIGLDLTGVEKVYRLNNYDYDIVRIINQRNPIRGHSTVVYSLKRAECLFDLYMTRYELQWGASTAQEGGIYQTEKRSSEGSLFSGFLGHFGIVDIVGYYIYISNESFGCTAHHFSNACFSGFGDDSADETRTPEIRH
ncbi:hypothetical protein EDB87DRAFT_1679470 [Lactarius vividus]|nr:hypothetical protein EDB87DRAFT_1679470 [Lactarius vividus]